MLEAPRALFRKLSAVFRGGGDKKQEKEKEAQRARPAYSHSSSLGRWSRHGSISLTYFEDLLRGAVVDFVNQKEKEGCVRHHHSFTQFWLQFGKLEAGFVIIHQLLEEHTTSKLGPLSIDTLFSRAAAFGLSPESPVLQRIVAAAPQHHFEHLDFVGFIVVLLAVHLTEPSSARGLHADVQTMLNCLENAFVHFESAKKGKLDKREVEDAMLEESSKACTREGTHVGRRTGHRLACKLFDSVEWSQDDTISFEKFLRGIVKMAAEEYGDLGDEEEEQEQEVAAETPAVAEATGVVAAAGTAAAAIAGHGTPAGQQQQAAHNGYHSSTAGVECQQLQQQDLAGNGNGQAAADANGVVEGKA